MHFCGCPNSSALPPSPLYLTLDWPRLQHELEKELVSCRISLAENVLGTCSTLRREKQLSCPATAGGTRSGILWKVTHADTHSISKGISFPASHLPAPSSGGAPRLAHGTARPPAALRAGGQRAPSANCQRPRRARTERCPAPRRTEKAEGVKEAAPDRGDVAGTRGHGGAGGGGTPQGSDLRGHRPVRSLQRPPRAPPCPRPGHAAVGGQGQSSRPGAGAGREGTVRLRRTLLRPPPLPQNGGGGDGGKTPQGPAGRSFSFGLPPLGAVTKQESHGRGGGKGRGDGTERPGPARP